MMEFVENHMVIGSPFPKDVPEDASDYRNRLSDGCKHRADCFCCFDIEGYAPLCVNVEICPDARW